MEPKGYKGYIMRPRPYQRAKDGRWGTTVEMWRDQANPFTLSSFDGTNTYDSKEEAAFQSLNLGSQIIDGKFPGCFAP